MPKEALLSHAEQASLLLEAQGGCLQARNELVKKNLGLVRHMAQILRDDLHSYDECYSYGTEGLINCINQFDINKSAIDALPEYMRKSITNAILRVKKYEKVRERRNISMQTILYYSHKTNKPVRIEDLFITHPEEMLDYIHSENQKQVITEVLSQLPEKYKEVMALKYGFTGNETLTNREISNIIGVSPSMVAYIDQKVLKKFRQPHNLKRISHY